MHEELWTEVHDVIQEAEIETIPKKKKCKKAKWLSEEGNPACLSSCQGFSGPSSSCVWTPRAFPDDARGCQ